MLNFDQVLLFSSVSSEGRIDFPWLRASVSLQRGEWRNRNPYSALSLSSPHRWSTVIRFHPRFISYIQDMFSTYANKDEWTHTQIRWQMLTTLLPLFTSKCFFLYTKRKKTGVQLRISLEFPTLLAAVEFYIQLLIRGKDKLRAALHSLFVSPSRTLSLSFAAGCLYQQGSHSVQKRSRIYHPLGIW